MFKMSHKLLTVSSDNNAFALFHALTYAISYFLSSKEKYFFASVDFQMNLPAIYGKGKSLF